MFLQCLLFQLPKEDSGRGSVQWWDKQCLFWLERQGRRKMPTQTGVEERKRFRDNTGWGGMRRNGEKGLWAFVLCQRIKIPLWCAFKRLPQRFLFFGNPILVFVTASSYRSKNTVPNLMELEVHILTTSPIAVMTKYHWSPWHFIDIISICFLLFWSVLSLRFC